MYGAAIIDNITKSTPIPIPDLKSLLESPNKTPPINPQRMNDQFLLFLGSNPTEALKRLINPKTTARQTKAVDMLFRRFDKLPEQISCPCLIGQPLGVPLHGETEGMVREFNGFDQSIRGMTRNPERGCNVFESLMVQAVDLDDGLTKDLGDACPFFEFHFMDKHCPHVAGVGMIERTRKLVGDVRV